MTDEELAHAYTVQQLSTNEIARLVGQSPPKVTDRLNALNVEMRSRWFVRPERLKSMQAGNHLSGSGFEPRHDKHLKAIFEARKIGFAGPWSFKPGGCLYRPGQVGVRP